MIAGKLAILHSNPGKPALFGKSFLMFDTTHNQKGFRGQLIAGRCYRFRLALM
jgi:hypothetical protein